VTKIKKPDNTILALVIIAVMAFILPSGLQADTEDSKTIAGKNKKAETTSGINAAAFTLIHKDFLPKASSATLIPDKPRINPEPNPYYQRRLKRERFEKTLYNMTLVTSAALNIADYLSTREALRHEGLAEGNPIMKPFVKNDLAFAAAKFGLLTVNYFLMKKLHKKNKTLAWVLTVANNFVMSYVLVNNLKLIREI
jgi:hypothetical protein